MNNRADGKATRTQSLFRMQVAVQISIKAQPDKIWALLTNAQDFPRWNSTVQSIEGTISLGQTIKLKATIAPQRTFTLKVTRLEPHTVMIWQDGSLPFFRGIRHYTLMPKNDGTTNFSMAETFSGLMLPMIAGSLPDFRQSFEQYAADLKRAAE